MKVHTPYKEALEAFLQPGYTTVVVPLASGLINQSYKITNSDTGHSYLLQQINQQVFVKPEKLQTNYQLIWQYLKDEDIPFLIPHPQFFPGPASLYYDSKKRYWRVFDFIEGTQTLAVASNTRQVNEVASCFAAFTACFQRFNHRHLHITIPGFHDVAARFRQFQQSLLKATAQRKKKSAALITELVSREKYARFYDKIKTSSHFHKRVMHHDAKIANVLFDTVDQNHVTCPVDFDTVMPGYFFSDLGDMVRSIVCPEDENCTDPKNIHIRREFYLALADGYAANIDHQFTKEEKDHLHVSGLLMTYMQALRFLADYLQGDTYYRIQYPEQNYDRAFNQLTLLQKLEEFLLDEYSYSVK